MTRTGHGSTEPAARSAFTLVGPTAVGKTAVAHELARRNGWGILSADAMLVYRGMDIGTAKPSARQRAECPYAGIDLADPSEPFSAGDYFRHASDALPPLRAQVPAVLVAGGTGLYVRCITDGLDSPGTADAAVRAQAEDILAREGVAGLQAVLQELDPSAYAALADKQNPRRLVRALEIARSGQKQSSSWEAREPARLVGLRMEPDALRRRIAGRVRGMFAAGLVDEVRGLIERYGALSGTAGQAIGYKEAIALIENHCKLEEAIEQTIVRTRQLAKRQMTWFRHQARVAWVDMAEDEEVGSAVQLVAAAWEEHGATATAI